MGQGVRTYQEQSQTVQAFNQKLIVPLQKGMIIREHIIRWSGQFTVAAGDNLLASQGKGDEWSVFDRIDLVANGSDVIRSLSGTALRMWQRFKYQTMPRTSPFLGNGVANPAFDSVCILPLWMFGPGPMYNSMDSALDARQMSDLRLEFSIGSGANLNSAGAGASGFTAPGQLDIWTRASFGVKGPFSGSQVFPLQSPVIAAGAGTFDFLLPVTGVYKAIMMNYATTAAPTAADVPTTQIGTNAQLLTNTGISRIQLMSGTNTFVDIHPRAQQDWDQMRRGRNRERVIATAGAATLNGGQPIFQNLGRTALLLEDAWTYLDLVDDGMLSEAIDTVGASEMRLRLTFGGNNAGGIVQLWPEILYPVRAGS